MYLLDNFTRRRAASSRKLGIIVRSDCVSNDAVPRAGGRTARGGFVSTSFHDAGHHGFELFGFLTFASFTLRGRWSRHCLVRFGQWCFGATSFSSFSMYDGVDEFANR